MGLRFRLISLKKINFGGWTLWRGVGGGGGGSGKTLIMKKSICES